MTRRELREHCFKMLFCADFYPPEEMKEQLDEYFLAPIEDETTPEGKEEILHQVELDVFDRDYVRQKVEHMIEKKPELDVRIDEVAEGWKTKRMGRADLTILRLALYEIIYEEDVPERVAINEAVELAKKFGGDDSSAFINGILAKLV